MGDFFCIYSRGKVKAVILPYRDTWFHIWQHVISTLTLVGKRKGYMSSGRKERQYCTLFLKTLCRTALFSPVTVLVGLVVVQERELAHGVRAGAELVGVALGEGRAPAGNEGRHGVGLALVHGHVQDRLRAGGQADRGHGGAELDGVGRLGHGQVGCVGLGEVPAGHDANSRKRINDGQDVYPTKLLPFFEASISANRRF